MPDQRIDAKGVAALAGVSLRMVRGYTQLPTFPAPVLIEPRGRRLYERNDVTSWLAGADRPTKATDPDFIEAIRTAAADATNLSEVARDLNITRDTVRKYAGDIIRRNRNR